MTDQKGATISTLSKVAVGQRSRRKRGAQHVEGPERACPTVQCRAAAHNRAHAAKGSLSSELAHELFALLGVSLLHSDSLDSCPLLVRVRLRNRRNGKSVSVSAHAKNAQAQQMRLSDAWPQQLSKPRQRTRERNDVAHIRGCLARLAQCSGHMHITACFARGLVVVGGHHAPDSQRAHRP